MDCTEGEGHVKNNAKNDIAMPLLILIIQFFRFFQNQQLILIVFIDTRGHFYDPFRPSIGRSVVISAGSYTSVLLIIGTTQFY